MNLPTKLTVLRLFLSAVIIVLLCFPFYAVGVQFPKLIVSGITMDLRYLISGVIFIVASFTDFLDGHIARSRNLVTDTGKMLDAIADKVLVNPILIILSAQGFIPAIIPVLIITRDIIVDAIKMEAASKGKVVAAIKSGKIKTALMMVGLVLMFFYNFPFEIINLRVADFLLYFAAIMSVVSAFQYFSLNKEIIFPKEKEEIEAVQSYEN